MNKCTPNMIKAHIVYSATERLGELVTREGYIELFRMFVDKGTENESNIKIAVDYSEDSKFLYIVDDEVISSCKINPDSPLLLETLSQFLKLSLINDSLLEKYIDVLDSDELMRLYGSGTINLLSKYSNPINSDISLDRGSTASSTKSLKLKDN